MLVTVALVACSSDPQPAPAPSVPEVPVTVVPTETVPPPTTAADCPNEATVAANRALQNGPSRTGDVDGDGFVDEIYVEVDPNMPPPCSGFIVVHTSTGNLAATIWEMGSSGGLPEPRIHGLVDIDGDGALEVLVDEAAGASTQFVGAFTVDEGDLERLTPAEKDAGPQEIAGLFGYGGSVGHLEGVGCSGGEVVTSTALPGTSQEDVADGIYDVTRRFFAIEGPTLKLVRTDKRRLPADQIDSLPEYSFGPFGNC